MKQRALRQWTVVGICLLVAGAAFPADAPQTLFLGDLAPELDVQFIKGEPLSLEAGRGRKVFVVEFWATWCAPCVYSIPHLTNLQRKYRADGLVVVGISDESPMVAQPYVDEKGDTMDYHVAVDRGDKTKPMYFDGFGLESGIPEAFLIDHNGRIAWHGHPMNPFMDIMIQRLLDAIPPAEDRDDAQA
jgi:thiol-disulfide isomerase/thioredoxin